MAKGRVVNWGRDGQPIGSVSLVALPERIELSFRVLQPTIPAASATIRTINIGCISGSDWTVGMWP